MNNVTVISHFSTSEKNERKKEFNRIASSMIDTTLREIFSRRYKPVYEPIPEMTRRSMNNK